MKMLGSIVRSLLIFIFVVFFTSTSINGQTYKEKYRLQVHYSLPKGWANDPNGLVYANGYYHLFYQYNPNNITAGTIHWGHARSKDLIIWENLPIALRPVGDTQIFSGCCVVDKRNSSGIVTEANQSEVLLAVYTLHHNVKGESQVMSYSFDDGLTWTDYHGNPIIANPGVADFRDPNIFELDGKYYMTLAVHDRISYYTSDDLISWRELSSFGVNPDEGDKTGVWECPSHFSLSDERGKKHDVLIVSENGDKNGSLTQYFVGTFDKKQFKTYDRTDVLWLENGYDNYAAIPYYDEPKGRVVIIGWMSNWLYGQTIPTSTWRGQFTIPRELFIKTVNAKLHVAQRPVDEFNKIVDPTKRWSLKKEVTLKGKKTLDLTKDIPFKTGSLIAMDYVIDIGNAKKGIVSLQFGNDVGEFVSFNYDIAEDSYEFDRRKSGNVGFNDKFVDRDARADRIANGKVVTARVILDVASIEIFADDGLNAFTSLFFPTKPYDTVKVISNVDDSTSIKIQKVNVAALKSIWK